MIVYIEGSIASGKSTLIEKLKEKYTVYTEKIEEWNQVKNENGQGLLQCLYDDPEKVGFMFQVVVLVQRLKQLKTIINEMKPNELIVIERSPQSCQVFSNALQLSGLERNVFNYVNDFINAEMQQFEDRVCWLYIDTSVEECVNRIKKRGRTEEQNIPQQYLEALDSNYKEMAAQYNAFVVNGNASEQEVFNETIDLIDSISGYMK